jgi:hypothetical protein
MAPTDGRGERNVPSAERRKCGAWDASTKNMCRDTLSYACKAATKWRGGAAAPHRCTLLRGLLRQPRAVCTCRRPCCPATYPTTVVRRGGWASSDLPPSTGRHSLRRRLLLLRLLGLLLRLARRPGATLGRAALAWRGGHAWRGGVGAVALLPAALRCTAALVLAVLALPGLTPFPPALPRLAAAAVAAGAWLGAATLGAARSVVAAASAARLLLGSEGLIAAPCLCSIPASARPAACPPAAPRTLAAGVGGCRAVRRGCVLGRCRGVGVGRLGWLLGWSRRVVGHRAALAKLPGQGGQLLLLGLDAEQGAGVGTRLLWNIPAAGGRWAGRKRG